MQSALEKVDVLVTTGSVSMGERDILKPVLQQYFKATIHFGIIPFLSRIDNKVVWIHLSRALLCFRSREYETGKTDDVCNMYV